MWRWSRAMICPWYQRTTSYRTTALVGTHRMKTRMIKSLSYSSGKTWWRKRITRWRAPTIGNLTHVRRSVPAQTTWNAAEAPLWSQGPMLTRSWSRIHRRKWGSELPDVAAVGALLFQAPAVCHATFPLAGLTTTIRLWNGTRVLWVWQASWKVLKRPTSLTELTQVEVVSLKKEASFLISTSNPSVTRCPESMKSQKTIAPALLAKLRVLEKVTKANTGMVGIR